MGGMPGMSGAGGAGSPGSVHKRSYRCRCPLIPRAAAPAAGEDAVVHITDPAHFTRVLADAGVLTNATSYFATPRCRAFQACGRGLLCDLVWSMQAYCTNLCVSGCRAQGRCGKVHLMLGAATSPNATCFRQIFCKVDGDKNQAICQQYGVQAYPTFKVAATNTLWRHDCWPI